ncbi:hypothetical protein [Furfurilactobacillus entadae]|uniref:hypothetical protein n=1 Tax=Furfurilactobacillus entadae TaxID=2922307 RepID=UPI0035EBC5ED
MATLIAISQNKAGHLSKTAATARGGHDDFILILVLAIIMLILATVNFHLQAQKRTN